MLQLEQFKLIPIEELEHLEEDTWLFKLEIRQQKLAFAPSNPALVSLNSTINLKETSGWLDNISPGDILLEEVITNEKISEHEQTKIIDTRTFTRPRKNRTSPSPLRPTTLQPETTNLNSTFNFQAGDNVNGEVLNATVVIEETTNKLGATQGELNATFPVEINEPAVEDLSPCNNNVYNLNSTFPTIVSSNRSVTGSLSVKPVLNTTYSEDEPVQGPVAIGSRNCSLDELNELDEIEEGDRCDVNEVVFRKPLMPGAVPKRPLIRTSTWNNEIPGSPKKQLVTSAITPPSTNGMKDVEKCAKIQEDSLAQTSTPMGQRRFCAFQRAAEVDHNLGSPISSLADGTVNFGPPIPLRESIAGNANSDSLLDNSNNVIRGHLTFDKSQNSVENQSISPTSPASSPYSSQSLESETTGPATAQELIRRSMPNLNNPSRMRLPQPSALSSNLNRQHGSESGLRPPSANSGLRPPSSNSVNGSSLMRPQFKVPQPPATAVVQPAANVNRAANTTTDLVRPSQLLQPRSSGIAAPPTARNSYLPNAVSKLRPSQLVAPKASLPVKTTVIPAAKAVDELNATVVMEKPSVITAPSAPVHSGIPRPSLSRIPMPRTMKSSIPMPAARARAPPQ